MARVKWNVLIVILLNVQFKWSHTWFQKYDFPFSYSQDFQLHFDRDNKYKIVDPGIPLLLTPLINTNRFRDALNLAQVTHSDFFGIKSYSGFFTVNQKSDSNMFFWFFPSEEDYFHSSLILWLQGGPGDSSLSGLFTENGPFKIENGEKIDLRKSRWTKKHSVLYIDNPVGTGFSYTLNAFARNQSQVASDLYEALKQFYKLFPHLQKNQFFIAGESYAGKYIPAIAYKIDQENRNGNQKINLQGLAIASGFTDPVNQFGYAEYLYNIGLIDSNTASEMEKMHDALVEHINNQDWLAAYEDCVKTFDFFKKTTGMHHMYNYLEDEYSMAKDSKYMASYVTQANIRKAIHVGNLPYDSVGVHVNLKEDTMKSVAPWVSELLEKYRILVFNGQLDIIVAYPLTVNYLQRLKFSGANDYKSAQRRQWWVNGGLAGYTKVAGNLTEVLVRKAGHAVVYDQPEWTYDLIYKFVRNIPIS